MSKKRDQSFSKIQDFIDKYDWFYIIGHEKPDGDCLGSQLALGGLLEQLGKNVIQLSAGPFNDFVVQIYQSMFYTSLELAPKPPPKSKVAIFCVDCSSSERMGTAFEKIYHLPAAVIDHHTSGETYGRVRYIDSNAVANTLLIYRLFKSYKRSPTKENAYFLFLGLLTDTGFFRFTKRDDPEPFLVAAELTKLGVSAAEIYQQIGYGCTYFSRKIISKILNRATRVNNNRIVLSYISYKDYIYSDDVPQSYEVYQLLQGIQKIEMVVYIMENFDENSSVTCKIGLRSQNKVDVGKLAQHYGGGGHKNAAGFSMNKALDDTWKELLHSFDKYEI